ncbi:uncharacterized protein LOC119018973 isoform X2 [Acanthopagrus latus]|uniref:uncharacterized protein LOC119018973 isoform X2 n=1 Tax=Acanthopagrus latus TaxID=8177 RepID=UPI00187CD017|nr:uncharacterized protein LOC119018973 isoform X2 [Acanthopagrus latus]
MESLGFSIADSLKAEQRMRADRPRGLLLCLAPQSGACSPEWVCGCSSICRDVGRPRCFFRSHSGNRAVERVQSQAFFWQYERSQPVLNAVALRSNQSSPVSHHSACPSTGKAQPRAIMAANDCPTEQDDESPPAAAEDPISKHQELPSLCVQTKLREYQEDFQKVAGEEGESHIRLVKTPRRITHDRKKMPVPDSQIQQHNAQRRS